MPSRCQTLITRSWPGWRARTMPSPTPPRNGSIAASPNRLRKNTISKVWISADTTRIMPFWSATQAAPRTISRAASIAGGRIDHAGRRAPMPALRRGAAARARSGSPRPPPAPVRPWPRAGRCRCCSLTVMPATSSISSAARSGGVRAASAGPVPRRSGRMRRSAPVPGHGRAGLRAPVGRFERRRHRAHPLAPLPGSSHQCTRLGG